jgi:DNA-binding LacI/PurR family transcriptional regulator
MEAAGLPVLPEYVHQEAGGKPETGTAGAQYFLALPERPTAVMCFNDMMAIGVLQVIQQAGLYVPGDISVSGFDNIKLSAYTQPPLTTFDQPKRYIGVEAARLLFGLLDGLPGDESANPGKVRMLKGSLLVRQSTASPKRRRQDDNIEIIINP